MITIEPVCSPAMDVIKPANDARTRAIRSARGGYVLAGMVLLASLLVVLAYWRSAHQRQLDVARDDFVGHSEEIAALMVRRLDSYELVTRGGVSLVASVARPSRQQWQNYVDGLNIQRRFPALVGLGFAIHATPGQLSALQRMLRDSGEGFFVVRPRGPREYYGPILYLGPRSPENISALGYDMYVDPIRHAAMQVARDSGQAQLTGPVQLVQDGDTQAPSLLLYQPVYRAGDRPSSAAARRESMQGWVYVAFHMQEFVDTALRETPDRLWMRIVDIGDDGQTQLYADPAPDAGDAPAFVHETDLNVYGRHWRIQFRSQPMAALGKGMTGLRSTLMVGLLASLLLFLIALVLARTRERAERLAGRMTESYRRSELRFRSAMQYSAIGMALLDHDDRIVEANPALAELLQSTPGELVGKQFDSYLVGLPDETEGAADAAGPHVDRVTANLRCKNGETRYLQLIYAPVPGEIEQDVARLVQVQDMTELLHAQKQSLALNRTLEARVHARTRDLTRANDELESFAYSVSHDLRAPLRAIDGFSRLLAERYDTAIDEAGLEHIARVRGAAARMGELIESLLKMARLGRGGLKRTPLDLSTMSHEVISELRADDTRDVAVEIAPGLRATGDQGLVYNLLENLIGNAWKFTRGQDRARIEIGCTDDGEFFVRDNGAGFVPEYANKLFRPFQRLHSEAQFAGHGIGLASVKRIVERHDGAIRAEGKPGQGATFYFTLPDDALE